MAPRLLRVAAAAALAASTGAAAASQFYVFPIEHVEGLSAGLKPESRPLIDPAMRQLLTRDDAVRAALHARVRDTLLQQLQAAYPGSVVNAAQVSTTRGGGSPAYLDEVSCGQGFRAPLRQSYAVVAGVSRASLYRVPRIDGRVEVLVPVTMNLQLLKPDAGKIVYSLSDTQYRSFFFGADEADTPAARQLVVDALQESMPQQVAALVAELKAAFQPRETVAKVLGEDQKSFVLDKGVESGLQEGEQIEVTHRGAGKDILIAVLSSAPGYSVVRPVGDALRSGDELQLFTGAAADDSRKPRVLPVVSEAPGQEWTASVAELFGKQIGFKAPFQILPADPHFGATMTLIDASLRCLDERAKKALKKVAGERAEEPDFFLRFERAKSPTFRQVGLGGVETRESFVSTVTAQLVDAQGDVVFSAIGSDLYRQKKVGGQGIAAAQAEEISLKNATGALARQLLEQARLEPAEFRVAKVEGGKVWAQGLALPAGAEVAFELLRPLSVKVGPRPALRRLALAAGDAPPAADGAATVLSFVTGQAAQADDQPRAGDLLRVLNLPKAGRTRLSECRVARGAGSNSLAADHLLPLLRHAAYASTRLQVNVGTPDWTRQVNALLAANGFRPGLAEATPTESCLRPAYIVRPEPPTCTAPDSCAAKVRVSSAVLQERAGVRESTVSLSHALTLEGFAEAEATPFAAFKAHEHLGQTLPDLVKSLDHPPK